MVFYFFINLSDGDYRHEEWTIFDGLPCKMRKQTSEIFSAFFLHLYGTRWHKKGLRRDPSSVSLVVLNQSGTKTWYCHDHRVFPIMVLSSNWYRHLLNSPRWHSAALGGSERLQGRGRETDLRGGQGGRQWLPGRLGPVSGPPMESWSWVESIEDH